MKIFPDTGDIIGRLTKGERAFPPFFKILSGATCFVLIVRFAFLTWFSLGYLGLYNAPSDEIWAAFFLYFEKMIYLSAVV